MTIASCLVLPEGVVFGVDSTTSMDMEYGYHYLNHNQKLFEVGEDSSLAIMTWGLSGFRDTSYRTLIALLSDRFNETPPSSVRDAAASWSSIIWDAYRDTFKAELERIKELEAKQAVNAASVSDERSEEEDDEYKGYLENLRVGFCIGSYCERDRKPEAFWFEVGPTQRSPSNAYQVQTEKFWGQPNVFLRLFDGFDFRTRQGIIESPFWKGSERDLDALLEKEAFVAPQMTIRDGIDFVHFSIYATIKALKFSTKGQVCGGPIELAVITTDRKFRWVRHKAWDSAVGYDGP
jgi:hypothetical protein